MIRKFLMDWALFVHADQIQGLSLPLALELGTEQSPIQVTHSVVMSTFCQPLATWYASCLHRMLRTGVTNLTVIRLYNGIRTMLVFGPSTATLLGICLVAFTRT